MKSATIITLLALGSIASVGTNASATPYGTPSKAASASKPVTAFINTSTYGKMPKATQITYTPGKTIGAPTQYQSPYIPASTVKSAGGVVHQNLIPDVVRNGVLYTCAYARTGSKTCETYSEVPKNQATGKPVNYNFSNTKPGGLIPQSTFCGTKVGYSGLVSSCSKY